MGKSDLRKNFGARLREALNVANIRAVDIARDLGVTQRAVSGWTGGTREPKFEVLLFLYRRYGINPLYIITGQGPPVIEKAKETDLAYLAAQALSQGKGASSDSEFIKKNFSDVIKSIAEKKGMSLRKLAIKAGIPYNSLYRWVKKGDQPPAEALAKIYLAFPDINPIYLLTGHGPPTLAQPEDYIEKRKAELRTQIKALKNQIEALKRMQESLEKELALLEQHYG